MAKSSTIFFRSVIVSVIFKYQSLKDNHFNQEFQVLANHLITKIVIFAVNSSPLAESDFAMTFVRERFFISHYGTL